MTLRRHLTPALDATPIADIQPEHVRRWRKHLLDEQVSPVTAARAYRLLKTIMTAAVDDGVIGVTCAGFEFPGRNRLVALKMNGPVTVPPRFY